MGRKADDSQDISKISVSGLEPTSFIDKVGGAVTKEASGSPITFSGELDRVYTDSLAPITIEEGGTPKFEVLRDGMSDVVVWNPVCAQTIMTASGIG